MFLAWYLYEQLMDSKDWVHGFWGYIMGKFILTLWQVKKFEAKLLPVAPALIVYLYIISGHNHKQLSC